MITELTSEQIKNNEYLSLAKSGHFFLGSVGSEYPRAYHTQGKVFIVDSPEDEIGNTWELIKELILGESS